MQGFPPPADKTVRFNDGSSGKFPGTRWAFSHIRELGPTANVWRGEGPVAQLPRAERDLDKISVTTLDGKSITFGDMPALTYTDGLLVLHKGRIIYERRGRRVPAAHRLLGHQVVRWHAGGDARSARQARSRGAGRQIRARAEGLRVR